MKTATS
ncbi:hypothetical protein EC100833_3004, partial [Escherichia coli 10.0833]